MGHTGGKTGHERAKMGPKEDEMAMRVPKWAQNGAKGALKGPI